MIAGVRATAVGDRLFVRGRLEKRSVLGVTARVRTRVASTAHGLLTKEWTPLEPGVVDHKLYIRGIGLAVERSVSGGNERAVLVAFRPASR